MINSYHFGHIVVNGKSYNEDMWIDTEGKVHSWWRTSSHVVEKKDLAEALKEKPEIVVIGTGESGLAEVYSDVLESLEKEKINYFIKPTGEAIKTYNKLKGQNKKIIGLFHLTC